MSDTDSGDDEQAALANDTPDEGDDQQNQQVVAEAIPTGQDEEQGESGADDEGAEGGRLPAESTPTEGKAPEEDDTTGSIKKADEETKPNTSSEHDWSWSGLANFLLNGFDNHHDQIPQDIAAAHADEARHGAKGQIGNQPQGGAPPQYGPADQRTFKPFVTLGASAPQGPQAPAPPNPDMPPDPRIQVPGARGPARVGTVAAPSAAEGAQPETPTATPAPAEQPGRFGAKGQVGTPPPPTRRPTELPSPAGIEGAQPQSPNMPPTREMITQGFITPEQRAQIDRADPSKVQGNDPTFGLPGSNSQRPKGNPGQATPVQGDPQAKAQLDQLVKAGYPPSQIARQWPDIVKKSGVTAQWDAANGKSVFQPIMTKTAPTQGPEPQYYGAPQPNAPRLPSNPTDQRSGKPIGTAEVRQGPAAQGRFEELNTPGGGAQATPQNAQTPNQDAVKIVRGGKVSYADPKTGQESRSLPGHGGLDPDLQQRLDGLPKDKNGNPAPGAVQIIQRQQAQRDAGGTGKGAPKGQTAGQRQTALERMEKAKAGSGDAYAKTHPAFAKDTSFEADAAPEGQTIMKAPAGGVGPKPIGPPPGPGYAWSPSRGAYIAPPQ